MPTANTSDPIPNCWHLATIPALFHPSNLLGLAWSVECTACNTRHTLHQFLSLN